MDGVDETILRMAARLGLHDGSGLLLDVAGTNAEDLDQLVGQLGSSNALEALSDACWDKDALLISSVQGARCLACRHDGASRVAIFYHTLGTGGAERITLDTVRMWRAMGHEVLLLCDEGWSAGIVVDEGVTLIELPDCLSPDHDVQVSRAKALYEALASFGADVLVYCQWLSPTLAWDLLATKLAGASFVVFTHGTTRVLTGYGNPPDLRFPSIYRHADGVVCLSEEDACFWRTFNGSVWRVINKCDQAFFEAQEPQLKGHRIGWVGRVSSDKAPLEALDVLRAVRDEVADATLTIAGPFGDCTSSQFQAHAEGLGVWEAVEVMGDVPHEQLPDLLASFDVVLFTSHMEGYPVSLAEAKAAGVPCAMYDLSHLTLLEGGRGVLVAPIGDADALAKQVVEILTDKALAVRMGAEAREHALELQSFDLDGFWGGVLASKSGAATGHLDNGAGVACALYEAGRAELALRDVAASMQARLEEASHASAEVAEALHAIEGSVSFRVGRMLTLPLRTLRDLIR